MGMEGHTMLFARSLEELSQVMELVPRQGKCRDCDAEGSPDCPSCPSGESCQYRLPSDCTECVKAVCEPDPGSDDSNGDNGGGDSDGPNAGAIAGGVVGGVIFIAIVTYLVWRYLIRPKRAEEAMRQSMYTAGGIDPSQDSEKDGASRLTRRSSTHTVHSIASTVLTRASNIIQIAYIPGVTNRANPNSAGVLVPPVPPIPMHHSQSSQHGSDAEVGSDDQHFFMPGDLRDSTYSGLSGYSDRNSYATRTSYAPRSSIASTIYGKQAQVMTPASTGMRAKPTMVSVKSAALGSGMNTPPVPSIDYEKFNAEQGNGGDTRPRSEMSTFSVGSTFLKTATEARAQGAQVVKVGGGLKKVDISAKSSSSSLAADANRSASNLTVNESPFNDPPEGRTPSPSALKPGNPSTLGPVMEDGDEEHKDDLPRPRPASLERGSSPFGDEHATR